MTTRKTPAKKFTAARTPVKRPTTKKSATSMRTARRPSTRRRTTRRRPQPALSTTIGSAIGALVVTTLLDLSWPMRVVLVVLALVLGLGYLAWKRRSAASTAFQPASPDAPVGASTDAPASNVDEPGTDQA